MMNKLKRVIENYPAEKLPKDVRGEIDPSHRVRVTVEDDADDAGRGDSLETLMRRIDEYHRAHPGSVMTSDEAVARVRALRDEWD